MHLDVLVLTLGRGALLRGERLREREHHDAFLASVLGGIILCRRFPGR